MRRLLRMPVAVLCAFGISPWAPIWRRRSTPSDPERRCGGRRNRAGRRGSRPAVVTQRNRHETPNSNQPVGDATIASGSVRVITGPDGRFRLPTPAGVVVPEGRRTGIRRFRHQCDGVSRRTGGRTGDCSSTCDRRPRRRARHDHRLCAGRASRRAGGGAPHARRPRQHLSRAANASRRRGDTGGQRFHVGSRRFARPEPDAARRSGSARSVSSLRPGERVQSGHDSALRPGDGRLQRQVWRPPVVTAVGRIP